MSPSWVAPCYVYRSRKCSPGLKISLAAARQEMFFFGGEGGGQGEGMVDIFRKFRDFAAVKSPRFFTKLCPRPWTRDFDNSKTFDHYEDWGQCIHGQVRSILSFMRSLTLIEEHNIIIFSLSTHSTFSLPCKMHPRNESFHSPELTRIRLCYM